MHFTAVQLFLSIGPLRPHLLFSIFPFSGHCSEPLSDFCPVGSVKENPPGSCPSFNRNPPMHYNQKKSIRKSRNIFEDYGRALCLLTLFRLLPYTASDDLSLFLKICKD